MKTSRRQVHIQEAGGKMVRVHFKLPEAHFEVRGLAYGFETFKDWASVAAAIDKAVLDARNERRVPVIVRDFSGWEGLLFFAGWATVTRGRVTSIKKASIGKDGNVVPFDADSHSRTMHNLRAGHVVTEFTPAAWSVAEKINKITRGFNTTFLEALPKPLKSSPKHSKLRPANALETLDVEGTLQVVIENLVKKPKKRPLTKRKRKSR